MDRIVDRGGDDIIAAGQAEDECGGEGAKHFGEDEDGGAENAGHHQGQGDTQHGPDAARPHDLRCLLKRGVHRLHNRGDHDECNGALEQRHDPGDAIRSIDIDEMPVPADRTPDLVDEAAFWRAEQAPGQRAEQWRQIIGYRH